jgi:ribonuclease D
MQPFGKLMADANIEKVLHAAEYDMLCMKRDFGYTFTSLFDTMIAARICGRKAIGLGALLAAHVGVQLDKSHQRDNWGKRPLPQASLRYAQTDTHYLPRLRDLFHDELTRAGHLDEAQEIFAEFCDVPAPNGRHFDPDGFWGIGIANHLTLYQTGILKALYHLRDDIARERNTPPFKVMGNKLLVEIARADPNNLGKLKRVRGMSPHTVRRYGERILRVVKIGRTYNLAPPPQPPAPDPTEVELYSQLHTWRKTRAQERGVESDVIISKHTLWKLAQVSPSNLDDMIGIKGLGPWRLATYGTEILDVIRAYNENGAN